MLDVKTRVTRRVTIGLERYNDVKAGDVIECFRMDEVKRTLESAAAAGAPATE